MTTNRIISGDALRYWNGLSIENRYETRFAASSWIPLERPPPLADLLQRYFSAIPDIMVSGEGGFLCDLQACRH
jgi:hypothetical protein